MSEFECRVILAIRGLVLLVAGTLVVYQCAYYRALPEARFVELSYWVTWLGVCAIMAGVWNLCRGLRAVTPR